MKSAVRASRSSPRRRYSSDRRVAPRKPKRNLPWRWIFGIGLALELIAAAFTSPWTGLRSITINGSDNRDEGWLRDAFRPMRGQPVLAINGARIQHLLNKEPRIRTAEVRRGIDGRLTVRLAYRRQYARASGPGWTADIDELGIPFQRSEGGESARRIEFAGPVQWPFGSEPEEVKPAMAVFRELDRRRMGSRAKITVDSTGEMCLNIPTLSPVRLGGGDRVGAKIKTLQTILQRDPTLLDKAEYLDLKCPEAPAVRWNRHDAPTNAPPDAAKKASTYESGPNNKDQ